MAGRIKLLPDHVANQIAAGEVVQRPASVVKELMENAIDAGAKHIQLIVKDGGKTLIQVVDDGMGMSPTDARMCFERHATSKLSTAEELYALRTKGFRGEALASIAAIAQVELLTRTAEEEVGSRIQIAGSTVEDQQTEATAQGTSILVKNLFYNVPARRNFLKSNNVEQRHITDEFHRVALAHPEIEFHYYSNGSELFHLPQANLRRRIVHIFGNKFNEKLVPVAEETQVAQIGGFICKPEFARKTRGEQFFFVNSRFIKSPFLHHAVMAAFEGLIRPDAFPGYFIYFQIDPSKIDVNIHPTKTEIKFNDEQALYAILRATLKHSLGQFNVAPVLDFEKDPNLETPYAYQGKAAQQPGISVDPSYNPFKGTMPGTSRFKQVTKQAWEALYVGFEDKGQDAAEINWETTETQEALFQAEHGEHHTAFQTFQLKQKYVVTSIKSGMLIIDQNRAHQRVLYEKYLRELHQEGTVSQQLLFPLSLSFSKSDMKILEGMQEDLLALGFIFDRVEEEQLTISGIPVQINEGEVGIVIDDLLAHKKEGAVQEMSTSDLLARTMAQAMAIKNGNSLDTGSQQALVHDLFGCKESAVSPYNKRVYIVISERDIDNKFN